METQKRTQCQMVLDYINSFGSITTMDAFNDLGVTRLASRICDLNHAGYRFKKTTETRKNRFEKTVSYTRYALEG